MGQEEESAEWAAYIAAKNAIEVAKSKAAMISPPGKQPQTDATQGAQHLSIGMDVCIG